MPPIPVENPLRAQLLQSLNFYYRALDRSAELLERASVQEESELVENLWPTLFPSWRHAEKIILQWVGDAYETRKLEWRYIFGTTLFLLFAGLSLVYLLWKSILKRMQLLMRQLEENVQYDRNNRLLEIPQDEIGYVGKLLNELLDRKERVQEHSNILADRLKEYSVAFIETADLQKGNLLQQEQIAKQVGLAAEQISTQTGELILSTGHLKTVIQEAASLAQGERLELAELEFIIGRLLKASKEIEQLLQCLNQETTGITSETASLITLTDQSYLLALNTSIEASRGSDSSSGFSVIAQEIHRLADQAAAVTLDIDERFKSITNTFISNAQQIEGFASDINAGEVHSARVRERLAQLLDKVESIDGNFESMQKGVEQQIKDAESIGKLAETLTDVT